MNFNNWIDTLVSEKGLDIQQRFEHEGANGTNSIPLGCVIEAAKSANRNEQAQIKTTLVKIDFMNGDVCHFFSFLAKGLAI